MKHLLTFLATIVVLSIAAGCTAPIQQGELFTVDFQKNQTLRYKFVSTRIVDLNLDPSKQGSKAHNKSTESVEVVIAYNPIEVEPYGLTKIKAVCESVKAGKSKGSQKDAVETIAGKTFTLTVGPDGRIADYSQLKQLIQQAGREAFRKGSTQGRIKEPDMIDDFIATQWFLWDSISSIEKPAEGLSIGQNWKSQLLTPNSMVVRQARDVTYTLEEIRQTDKGRVAVISSSYSLAESTPKDWPIPYSGRFRLAGTFGFFRMIFKGLKITDIQGSGEEFFNIDTGRIEQYQQNYQMLLEAGASPLPGAKPEIKIDQKITMKLLED